MIWHFWWTEQSQRVEMLKNYYGIFGEHCSLNIPIMPECQMYLFTLFTIVTIVNKRWKQWESGTGLPSASKSQRRPLMASLPGVKIIKEGKTLFCKNWRKKILIVELVQELRGNGQGLKINVPNYRWERMSRRPYHFPKVLRDRVRIIMINIFHYHHLWYYHYYQLTISIGLLLTAQHCSQSTKRSDSLSLMG